MEEIQDQAPTQVNSELEEIKENNAESVNLQNMRASKEESDRRLEEVMRENERLKSLQVQPKPVVEAPDDLSADYDEEMVEGKHLRKRDVAIKDLQNKFNNLKKETEETIVSNRLNLDHPDYKKVMTDKNIDKLIKQYPEFADTLNSNTNKYTQYKSAYQLIKLSGIYQDSNIVSEKKTISDNLAKPMPSNSIGAKNSTSPLTQARSFSGGMSEADKAEYRRLNRLASMKY